MAVVLLISDSSTSRLLQVPFTLDNLSGYLDSNSSSNTLVLKQTSSKDDRKAKVLLNLDTILNEIKQRKLDISKLEEDLKILNANIEKIYKTADETKIGSEYITLIGLISNHKNNIELLKKQEKKYSYTVTNTCSTLNIDPGVITKLPDGFCDYNYVTYIDKNIVTSIKEKTTSVITEKNSTMVLNCPYKVGDTIYYKEINNTCSKNIVGNIFDNSIVVMTIGSNRVFDIYFASCGRKSVINRSQTQLSPFIF